MVNSSEFAERLQNILSFYGLSATAFSDKIDFNRSTISHILSGRNKPSLEFVMKVVQNFPEVELYWLLNGKGAFPNKNSNTHSPIAKSSSDIKNVANTEITKKIVTDQGKSVAEIERIVIFYKDGSFNAYEN